MHMRSTRAVAMTMKATTTTSRRTHRVASRRVASRRIASHRITRRGHTGFSTASYAYCTLRARRKRTRADRYARTCEPRARERARSSSYPEYVSSYLIRRRLYGYVRALSQIGSLEIHDAMQRALLSRTRVCVYLYMWTP